MRVWKALWRSLRRQQPERSTFTLRGVKIVQLTEAERWDALKSARSRERQSEQARLDLKIARMIRRGFNVGGVSAQRNIAEIRRTHSGCVWSWAEDPDHG